MKRRFIVTADDFGASPIIDIAVRNAVEAGIVTTVACFPNGNMESVVKLQQDFPDVEIGCHFTITSGKRLSIHSNSLSKKDSFDFKGKGGQHPDRAEPGHLYLELQAQLKQFADAGIEVKHFSDHMGILSYHKSGLDAMLKVVKDYSRDQNRIIPMRNPVFVGCIRHTRGTCLESSALEVKAGIGAALKNAITGTGNLFRKDAWEKLKLNTRSLNRQLRRIHAAGIPTTDYFVESFYGQPSEDILTCIQRHTPGKPYYIRKPIHRNKVCSEIMVHLAIDEGDGLNRRQYKKAIDELKTYGGVAIKYLKNKRVKEYERLMEHFKNRFPESELGGFV